MLKHSELVLSYTTVQVPCPMLWFEKVRGGSVGLNHPKLMTNYPMIVISSEAQRFEKVQLTGIY